MKKIIGYIILTLLCNFLYAQTIDPEDVVIYLNESLNAKIYSFDYSYFSCKSQYDSSFYGFDTVYFKIFNNEIITCISKYDSSGYKEYVLSYYLDGTPYRKTNCKCGLNNGFDIMWYKNGHIMNQSYFENGEMIFPVVGYYESGEPEYQFYLRNYGRDWYKNGIVKYEFQYIDSTKYIEKCYYDNGQLQYEQKLSSGIQSFIEYNEQGDIIVTGKYYHSFIFKIGKWDYYYDNGIKERSELYNDRYPNQPEGIWQWWDKDGQLIKEEKYKNGELIKQKEYKLAVPKE